MKMRRAGIIITLCLTIGAAAITYGSVKDDLTALELEAGIDVDRDASISDR